MSSMPANGSDTAASTRTVDRALDLLAAVADHADGATLSDLARAVELSPSTASRLLATLAGRDFVRRDGASRYRPGRRLVQIAAVTLRQEPLYELAGPQLEALAQATGETANLAIAIDAERALYLRQVAPRRLVQTATWTGRTIPRAGTAMGAALAGQVGPRGYAKPERTIEPDVTAVAAPVRGADGGVLGALSVLAPKYRTPARVLARHGAAVVRAAAELSLELGAPAAEAAA